MCEVGSFVNGRHRLECVGLYVRTTNELKLEAMPAP